jgi:hypothetical protein
MRIGFVHRRVARFFGWLAFAAAVVPFVAGGVLSLAGSETILEALTQAFLWSAQASIPLALVSFLTGRAGSGQAGRLRLEGDELVIERRRSERRLPLSTVRGGIIVPTRDRVSVELHLSSGDHVTATVADIAEAEALLRELRVDVANQRCRLQIADPAAALVVSMGAPFGLALYGMLFLIPFWMRFPSQLTLVLVIGLYALLAALVRSIIAVPEITVGTDGLAFQKGLGETFVPFAELADVRLAAHGVRLVRRDGRQLLVRSIAAVSPTRFEALKLRIREVMAARDAAPTQGLAQLDRGGRTVPEWRASLAALARRGADYRAVGLSTEDLEALLASPDATAERRLAAALALSASKHPGAPERIRIAAAQCASERLRVAMEKTSEGEEDDAAIAEALEDEEAQRSVRS